MHGHYFAKEQGWQDELMAGKCFLQMQAKGFLV